MRPGDVLSRPARPADLTFSYGREDQVADLWLPPAGGQAALVLFLHGGFWRAAFDRRHAGPLAEGLAAAGFAVCVPEYRRVGQAGGGWPGTFDDISAAVSRLPGLVAAAASGRVDGRPPVLAGHSAGGHLALWAAGQKPRPSTRAVVSLAGVCDLVECDHLGLGQGAAAALMGGRAADLAGRYREADPMAAIPTGAGVVLLHGTADDRVPSQLSEDYASAAGSAGDDARCVLLPGAGHFDVIDPLSGAWPAVLAEFLSVI